MATRVAMELEALTRSGNPPQRLHEQPSHGLDPAGRQRDTERLLEPAGRGASLKLDDPYWGLVERGRAARLEDLRHEVAKQVLERDQARRPAELVQHGGQVTPAPLHFQPWVRRA